MSRILRRPMFRGGRVSSYGTGIAAPLVPGYQGGGQIGGGIIYGKPMADGRYGFDKPYLPIWARDADSRGYAIGSDLNKPTTFIPSANEVASNTAGKINEVETVEKSEEFQPKSFEDVQQHSKVQMEGTPKTLEEIDELVANYGTGKEKAWYDFSDVFRPDMTEYANELKWKQSEGGKEEYRKKLLAERKELIKKRIKMNLATEAEIAELGNAVLNEPGDGPTVDPDTQKLLDRIAFLEGQQSTEEPEVDAKTAVAENKELFRDLLGYDKAKGQDISEMLLGFAGAEGDDTWSKTKSFFKDEAKRPGRAQKISDAAGTLAIQDYIAGKRSKEQIEKLKSIETFKLDEQLKRIYPQADDEWIDAVRKGAGKDGSFSSDSTIKKALSPKADKEGKPINVSVQKKDLAEISKDKDEFEIGFTIVTLKGGKKVIIEKTATDIQVRKDLPIF